MNLFPKLDQHWVEYDEDAKSFIAYLTDLSEKMIDRFMKLDMDSQRIVLMMMKFDNVDDIMKRLH